MFCLTAVMNASNFFNYGHVPHGLLPEAIDMRDIAKGMAVLIESPEAVLLLYLIKARERDRRDLKCLVLLCETAEKIHPCS